MTAAPNIDRPVSAPPTGEMRGALDTNKAYLHFITRAEFAGPRTTSRYWSDPAFCASAWVAGADRVQTGDDGAAKEMRYRDLIRSGVEAYATGTAIENVRRGRGSIVDLTLVLDGLDLTRREYRVVDAGEAHDAVVGFVSHGRVRPRIGAERIVAEAKLFQLLPPNLPPTIRALHVKRLVRAARACGYRGGSDGILGVPVQVIDVIRQGIRTERTNGTARRLARKAWRGLTLQDRKGWR